MVRIVDEMKAGMRSAARASAVMAAIAFTAFATLCFLCAAAFVVVFESYGLLWACLAGAGVFLVVTIFLLIWLDVLRQRAARRKEAAKSTLQAAATDPMVIAAGLQLVRAVGVKRLIPLVALGGVALGLLARAPKSPAEKNRTD